MNTAHGAPSALPAWLYWQEATPIDHAEAPTRAAFVERWGAPGLPVKLGGLTDSWPARQRWSMAFFEREHGACEVTVEARTAAGGTRKIRLDDYLATLEAPSEGETWYLKDWVFREQAPALLSVMPTPIDW